MTSNRFSVIVAMSVIAALALLTISMIAAPHSAVSSSSSAQLAQRRGEWATGASSEQAYLDQRHGEQTAGNFVDSQQAYMDQRHSEQTTGNFVDSQQAFLDQRHGEQTAGVNAALAYLQYRQGEWSGK